MLELRQFNVEFYDWLVKIEPENWARSHFSGRAVSDVLLNNMCEVLNRWLVDGRDKPIVTCLEFCREYLMKRIVIVKNVISKCHGPLTPSATKLFEDIKVDAVKYTVLWGGSHTYQVNGPHNDQVVVDVDNKTCACRRWLLTGMPCKQAVAVNMAVNGKDVGIPESWVHPVYWSSTWKKTNMHTIEPVNGISLRIPSQLLTKLVAPRLVPRTGRLKKTRQKGADEENIGQGTKLSKKNKPIVFGHCGQSGHNRNRCKNVGVSTKLFRPQKRRRDT